MDIEEWGQVFTPPEIVKKMLSYRRNFGRILEPSAGGGAFWVEISENKVGVEIDPEFCPKDCLNQDFFSYDQAEKFDTIIGNPPYVAFKNIKNHTRNLLPIERFDHRTNLYLFFIDKCFHHLNVGGEMIFITPRDFIKATSAVGLNNLLWNNGTITHFTDLGDLNVFKGYTPNCAIWRYVKDDFSRKTGDRNFTNINGQLCFTKEKYTVDFKDLFAVKVGAVSGADDVFIHEDGNEEFVCSSTRKDGKLQRVFYNIKEHPQIQNNKDVLLGRRIKKFNEKNWWTWGRNHFISEQPRIYVNCKTRIEKPFFTHPCKNYDGSVLALFLKKSVSEGEMVEKLNGVDWEGLGFKVGGRYVFAQRSLEQSRLPESFATYNNPL